MTHYTLNEEYFDQMLVNPELARLSEEERGRAALMDLILSLWSQQRLLDGYVPEAKMDGLVAGWVPDPEATMDKLMDADVWRWADDDIGVQRAEWPGRTRAQVEEARAAGAARERLSQTRLAHHRVGDHRLCDRCEAVEAGWTADELVDPSPLSKETPDRYKRREARQRGQKATSPKRARRKGNADTVTDSDLSSPLHSSDDTKRKRSGRAASTSSPPSLARARSDVASSPKAKTEPKTRPFQPQPPRRDPAEERKRLERWLDGHPDRVEHYRRTVQYSSMLASVDYLRPHHEDDWLSKGRLDALIEQVEAEEASEAKEQARPDVEAAALSRGPERADNEDDDDYIDLLEGIEEDEAEEA